MFVEVYVPHFEYEHGVLKDARMTPDTIVSLNKVVNVAAISSINLIPTFFGNKNYYKISLVDSAKDEFPIDQIYIDATSCERLIH